MTVLMDQILSLSQELDLSIEGESNRVAIGDNENIYDELSQILGDFLETSESRNVLAGLPDEFSLKALEENEFEQYRVSHALLKKLFTEWEDVGHKIRGTNSLNDSVSSIRALITMIANKNEIRWRGWLAAQRKTFEVPEVAFSMQEKAPPLKANAKEYTQNLGIFKILEENLPDSLDAITQIETCANVLRKCKQKMVFDLPESMERFFEYTSSAEHDFAFPLSMLTEEVKDWLENNGELQNYSVQRKTQGR